MNKNIILIVLLVLISFGLGFVLGQSSQEVKTGGEDVSWVLDTHFPELTAITEIRGDITKVESDGFYISDMVQTKRFPQEDGSHSEMKEIKVLIGPDTTIYQDRMPTEEEMDLSLEEMQEATREELSLSDLAVGTRVQVESDDDARQNWQMTATEVRVDYLPGLDELPESPDDLIEE
jgi:hypothetical protein